MTITAAEDWTRAVTTAPTRTDLMNPGVLPASNSASALRSEGLD